MRCNEIWPFTWHHLSRCMYSLQISNSHHKHQNYLSDAKMLASIMLTVLHSLQKATLCLVHYFSHIYEGSAWGFSSSLITSSSCTRLLGFEFVHYKFICCVCCMLHCEKLNLWWYKLILDPACVVSMHFSRNSSNSMTVHMKLLIQRSFSCISSASDRAVLTLLHMKRHNALLVYAFHNDTSAFCVIWHHYRYDDFVCKSLPKPSTNYSSKNKPFSDLMPPWLRFGSV